MRSTAKAAASAYQAALAEAQKERPDNVRVLTLLNRAIDSGHPEAAYALATWYLHGRNVRQDLRRALRLLKRAAEGKVASALYDLAVCYEKGEGTPKNVKRAVDCYLRAALHGDEDSIYEVGRCFFYGIGVTKNKPIAWAWLDRARELGVVGIPPDETEAAYSQSARRSRPAATPLKKYQGRRGGAVVAAKRARRRHAGSTR